MSHSVVVSVIHYSLSFTMSTFGTTTAYITVKEHCRIITFKLGDRAFVRKRSEMLSAFCFILNGLCFTRWISKVMHMLYFTFRNNMQSKTLLWIVRLKNLLNKNYWFMISKVVVSQNFRTITILTFKKQVFWFNKLVSSLRNQFSGIFVR